MDMKTEDFAHPENVYPGLIHSRDRTNPEFAKYYDLDDVERLFDENGGLVDHELCWRCGLTAYNQVFTSYAPRLKILHTRANMGMWALGSNWLLKDYPNDGCSPGNDYMTQKFLRSQLGSGLDIPILRDIQLIHRPEEKTYLYVMSRAEGQPLSRVWGDLSDDAKTKMREQLFEFMCQVRRFTAEGAQTVDGGKIDDLILGNCEVYRPFCKKVGFTNDEWFSNIEEELRVGLAEIHKTRDPAIIDREFQALKDNFPKSEPYVLTHGDICPENIIVKDDRITAIIDWEYSGYLPWWAERWLSIHLGTQCGPLMEPLFDRFEPFQDYDTFYDEVVAKIEPVRKAYKACQREHKDNYEKWMRPAFSKTEPWAGGFQIGAMGGTSERVHKILPAGTPLPELLSPQEIEALLAAQSNQ
ncbi:Protein kinase-like (PK-like) [Glarea lozoyensis ATCC 20868]|uniref:Protein kinase-like (PK-like) n=1 Tax=Glarea lozoyensis (strain ATCC 20868 / MF5171) TaxID=1116229 RepID=S3CRV3_GLAL2|nr:Protein kinase-like (PK-like) [Glarea lozoyensis ATCC 20868]EPE29187.1 Protein kinase-like (PK-like) [Glarea lozoyensis ATCC 20868]